MIIFFLFLHPNNPLCMSNLKASYPGIMDNYSCSGLYSVQSVAINSHQIVKLFLKKDFIRERLSDKNFNLDLIQFICKTIAFFQS